MNNRSIATRPTGPVRRTGRYVGPLRITPVLTVVLFALAASLAFIVWVVRAVRDEQLPLLAVGFVALGVSFGAIAVGALVGMWRAASRAEGGRAFGLAVVGGLAGLAAIGSWAVTALLMLVWKS